jgi:hypothetical protein
MTDEDWYADKRFKRDKAERELQAETDPRKRRSLRARRDRYEGFITMGPRHTSEASRKANQTRAL